MTVRVMHIREAFVSRYKDHMSGIGDKSTGMLEILGASFIADEPTIFGKLNEDYIKREIEWYDSKSLNVLDIPGGPPKIWLDVSVPSSPGLGHLESGTINSNYGFLLYHRENGRQFDHVLLQLLTDKNSRQAVAIYNRPSMHEDSKRDGMHDFVCTNAVQYYIRDGHLHVVVQMRSNDAVFGYRNDLAWQKEVQTRLLVELRKSYPDLKRGTIVWQAASLHIYPRHFDLVRQFMEDGTVYSEVTA